MKKMRICLLVTILLAIVPLYFKIRPDDFSYLKIKEFTDQTYQALHEIDPMYTSLVGGATVSGVYVKQGLGDAWVNVYVSVSQENLEEFVCWLKQENKNYTRSNDLFVFSYFVDEQKANLGQRVVKENVKLFNQIYWLVGGVLIIILMLPIEKWFKKVKSK